MNIEAIKDNIMQMKEILRELYVFNNQMNNIKQLEARSKIVINNEEKKLLEDVLESLSKQLYILNGTLPRLVEGIGFYKKLNPEEGQKPERGDKLIQIEYNPLLVKQKVSLTITDKDKKEFLQNLSRSNLSIYKLKKKYTNDNKQDSFGKPNPFAKLSNHFFKNLSMKLVSKNYFVNLNKDLRRMNSPFVVNTYVSMILFVSFLTFLFSIILFIVLLFYNISINYPFLIPPPETDTIFLRFFKFIGLLVLLPIVSGFFMFIYPSSEAKNLGKKIDQELPFVVIHMSAIATSGVEPISIFKIILKNDEYKNTSVELRKLINLINFHGKDFVSALKETASTCPSDKLKNLLDGLATTITSGGDLHQHLDKHAESLLFDYKIEREKYTKTSETFMDIYISIVIAAPMIFLMLFVIMGSTGTLTSYINLPMNVLSMLIILAIAFINVIFLLFLHLKQPKM